MTTLMQRGAAMLGRCLKTAGGIVVSVKQGSTCLTGITAWLVTSDSQVYDEHSATFTTFSSCNWTFVAADLPSCFEFKAGAEITDADGNKYEALPVPGQSGEPSHPASEGLDTSDVLITVHAKQVSSG